ncbi:MAG: ATP-binding protein [Candidatus Eremiobacterota bacterium]
MRWPGRGNFALQVQLGFLLLTLSVVAFVGLFVLRSVELVARESLEAELVAVASLLSSHWHPEDASRMRLDPQSNFRVTVVDGRGVVVADSHHDPGSMQNHASRPEFREALQGRVGIYEHWSETLLQPMLYVAVPLAEGGALRVAMPNQAVARLIARFRAISVAALGLAVVLSLLFSRFVSRRISLPLERLCQEVGLEGVPVSEEGPSEVVALGQAINRMRGRIDRQLQTLESERARLERLLEGLEEGVVMADAHGKVFFANASAAVLLGLLPPEEPARWFEALGERGTLREPLRVGQDRHLLLRAFHLPGGPDVDLVKVAVLNDVTEFVRLDELRRDFVANASHELRTPVAGIMNALEALDMASGDEPEVRAEFLRRAIGQAERLGRLLQQLLDLSRAERPPTEDRVCDAVAVLHEVADCAGRPLLLEAPCVPVNVHCDADDLTRALTNLVENAVKYGPEEGEVRLGLEADGPYAHLTVADRGPGIPQALLPRIFERFYRVDQARTRQQGGAGLGLAIARSLVERWKGSIRAENRPEGGLAVRISLNRT